MIQFLINEDTAAQYNNITFVDLLLKYWQNALKKLGNTL